MKLVLVYAVIAVTIAVVTGPIPGSSLLLTALEVGMAFHIARRYRFHLSIPEIGVGAGAVYGLSTFLKLVVSTLMEFVPIIGWFIAKPLIAFLFVVILGAIVDWYFKDKRRVEDSKK